MLDPHITPPTNLQHRYTQAPGLRSGKSYGCSWTETSYATTRLRTASNLETISSHVIFTHGRLSLKHLPIRKLPAALPNTQQTSARHTTRPRFPEKSIITALSRDHLGILLALLLAQKKERRGEKARLEFSVSIAQGRIHFTPGAESV